MYADALVRMVGGDYATAILWEATAFPFGEPAQIQRQLGDAIVLLQLGRDPIAEAHAALDKAMEGWELRAAQALRTAQAEAAHPRVDGDAGDG